MKISDEVLRKTIQYLLLEGVYPIDSKEEAEEFSEWLLLNYEQWSKENRLKKKESNPNN